MMTKESERGEMKRSYLRHHKTNKSRCGRAFSGTISEDKAPFGANSPQLRNNLFGHAGDDSF
jgi:hypothetical protein